MNKIIWLVVLIICFIIIQVQITNVQKENEIKKQNEKAEMIDNIQECNYLTESKQLKWCLEKYL